MSRKKTGVARAGEHDRRTLATRAEVRVVGDGSKREFIARVMNYNVVDDYGTVWLPGTFTESLAVRMPVVAWAHSWQEPIGRYQEVVEDNDRYLDLLGRLDDFDAVPRARQAYAQFQSGTLDQFSVGFTRRTWHDLMPGVEVPGVPTEQLEQWRGAGAWEVMTKADLDEASPVLVGAVPGTQLLGVRAGGQVAVDAVVELARRVRAGDLSHDEAKTALDLLAGDEPAAVEALVADDQAGVAADEDALVAELLAEADAALTRGRR